MQDHLLNKTLAIAYGVWAREKFLNHYDRFTDVFRLRYGFPAQPSNFPCFEKVSCLVLYIARVTVKIMFH